MADRAGKYVKNYKYNPGRRSPKTIWLPAGMSSRACRALKCGL